VKEKIARVCREAGLGDQRISDLIERSIMERITQRNQITIDGNLPSMVVPSGENLFFGRGKYTADVLVVKKRTFPYLSWKKPQTKRIFHFQITLSTLKWDYQQERLTYMKL